VSIIRSLCETYVGGPRAVKVGIAGVLGEVLEVQGSLGELGPFPGARDRCKVVSVRNNTVVIPWTYLSFRVARCLTA